MATPGKEPEGRLIYSCRESQRKTLDIQKEHPGMTTMVWCGNNNGSDVNLLQMLIAGSSFRN